MRPHPVPLVVTRRPRTPVPPALREILDELDALVASGGLTQETFGKFMSRAYDVAIPSIADEEEREAHLARMWRHGATIGCLRE